MVSPFQRILPSIFPSTIHLNFSSSFLCPISPRLPRIPSSFFVPVCLSAIREVDERVLPSLFFYPRIVLIPSPSFLFSGPPCPSIVSSFLPRPSSSLVPSFSERWLHLLVPWFPPHEAKTLFSRGPFSSSVSATLLSFSPLLYSPLCTTLLSYPLFRSLSLHRAGTPFSRFARWEAFYPLSFSSLPLLILHAVFPFPPSRCAFYVFPTLSTFFLGSSRTFSFRRTIVPSYRRPYRHSRDNQPALSPGKRKRKRLLPSCLVFQSEPRF